MKQAGVKSVRIGFVPPFEKTIDALADAAGGGISVSLVISLGRPNLNAADVSLRPAQGSINAAAPLSKLDPKFFIGKFRPLWQAIERRGIRLAAIELGNEINWAGFNGDLAVFPPQNSTVAQTSSIEALRNPDAFKQGLQRYIETLRLLKSLRDDSTFNHDAKLISAGLASIPPAFAEKIGAEYVDYGETLDVLNKMGLYQLVDGYGLHTYPNINKTPSGRAADFKELISRCGAQLPERPCWITEWGVAQHAISCPSDERRRRPLIGEMLQLIRAYSREGRIRAAFYFDWDANGPNDPYSIWRCGELTIPGNFCLPTEGQLCARQPERPGFIIPLSDVSSGDHRCVSGNRLCDRKRALLPQ